MQELPALTSQTIEMIVKSVTRNGEQPLSELEGERFLNAIARAVNGVPTGVNQNQEH